MIEVVCRAGCAPEALNITKLLRAHRVSLGFGPFLGNGPYRRFSNRFVYPEHFSGSTQPKNIAHAGALETRPRVSPIRHGSG